MSKKKYLKDDKGLYIAVTTDTLQLEKPLSNENYDVHVFNRNMDKVDAAIKDVKGTVDGLELTSTKVIRPNKKTVEESISANETSILALENEVLGEKAKAIATINRFKNILG